MIQVTNLNKTYDRGRPGANKVLRDLSFTLPETGFVCILGPSGCGKTTLLNAIGGLDRFDNGTLTVGEVSASRYGTALYEAERNRSFGYIFQNYYLLMDHSVAYNVYLGLHSLDISHKEKLQRVRQALKAVDMAHYLRRTVGELSGGQQQRVAIARALARRPRVIFADEPTGNLDEANTLNICRLLRQISKTSLVLMVTHEERIANFFADRIIRLSEGRIESDRASWERNGLTTDTAKTLYAGDYTEQCLDTQGLSLRLLQEADSPPVKLTVVALKDRVVLKLEDPRAITCGTVSDTPALLEGKRPVLTLETLEQEDPDSPLFTLDKQPPAVSGKGIPFGLQLREALTLSGGRGMKKWGLRLFLVLMAILTVFVVSDYCTLAAVDPEEFITTDSHILDISVKPGPVLYDKANATRLRNENFLQYLRDSGVDFLYIPPISRVPTYSVTLFQQLDRINMKFYHFSYIPLSELKEEDLLYGRMPTTSREIVVDRWVLEDAMEKDGILQNGIEDVSYFLDAQLSYPKTPYAPTIVGISDSGEPSVYIHPAGLVSIAAGATQITPLSELKALYPETYADTELGMDECIAVLNNAGESFADRIGGTFSVTGKRQIIIRDAIEADVLGRVVVSDELAEELMWDLSSDQFQIYCRDKDAMKELLDRKASEWEQAGYTEVTWKDRYETTYNAYKAASTMKADARTIVTFSVILVSMVMLYLLQRSRTRERIGMLAVYRLLGIPRRKLVGIFTMEALLVSLTAALPAVLLTWGYIQLAGRIPELESQLILPFGTAMAVYGALLVYHLLVSLLPLLRLLRLPPAQLAAKYDI